MDISVLAVLVVVVCLWCLVDVFYLVRAGATMVSSFLSATAKPSDTYRVRSVCWPTDIDYALHMNNSKYLREMDMGRFDFFVRSGLFRQFGDVVGGAIMIRYRRPVTVFTPIAVETKVVWTDEKSFYLQQRLISTADGFVRSDALVKMTARRNNPRCVLEEKYGHSFGECPPFVAQYIKADETGSKSLGDELGFKKTN